MASQSSGGTAHPSTMAHGTKEEIFFRRFCSDDKQIANLKQLEYTPDKFKAQLLHQAESQKYVEKKLETIPCFCEFNRRCLLLTSLDENNLQDAKDLVEKSVLIRSIHKDEYTRVKTKFLQFSDNYVTVSDGDKTVLVFTSNIEHNVDQILNSGCSMPQEETCSNGPDQFSQKGSEDKRNIKDGRSRLEAGSRGPDQFSQKGREDKRNIKDGRSRVEAGSNWTDQFQQKGSDDNRNIKDGRQEPHGAGKATVDVGVANKPDRNIGTNQETDLEAGCVEHFFDDNPSFYIDANIADILFSEMSSEIMAIEESGVKLHHDNGVITCKYLGSELVKHRLEALATSVHTKGFYHDCSSRYRCIQSDSIQEILNQAQTKVWYETVKPSQVNSEYLAKGISFNVYHGSVIGQLSDAIVYPVAQETGQWVPSGPTAHQLYHYGGEDFRKNIRFSNNIPWGIQFFSHRVPTTSYRRICLLCVTDWLTNSPHNEKKIVDRLYHILDNANREVNCSSLAIPLELGCRIPPLQVLNFIMKAINKYLVQQPEYRKVSTVSLVVTDSRYLRQVRQVLDNWKHKVSVQQPHKDPLDVDVSLVKGSLFDQRVDAIVVTVHKTLDQSKGGLAMELRRRGGKALEKQCKDLIPNDINPGEAVAVTAGDLNMCKHVILGYLPKNVNCDKKLCLKLLFENIFKAAKTQQVKSLAVPAIGSGVLNYPTQMCVTEILRSCFIHAQECGIQTVNLVVTDQRLYQEFDGYLWKYQENMETINQSQKHSEEVISADCNDLKVTISDTDHFGSFADMVIFHLDGSKRRDDKFVNGLRRESRHLHSNPWICETVHITEEEYEGQYKEAFKIANIKTVQLITLIWKGVENEGQDILQKISSIVELMRKELREHLPKVKLHVMVSQELKHSILDFIRSKGTSQLSSFWSYIPSFVGNKISWKIEPRPKKQFSAINGINLVAVSRDSKLLETYTNTLAQRLQEVDQQYCEKYKPQVPPRPEQKEHSDQVSGSFMEGKYGSSQEYPRNAQSDKRKPQERNTVSGKETHIDVDVSDQVSGAFKNRKQGSTDTPIIGESEVPVKPKDTVSDQVSGAFKKKKQHSSGDTCQWDCVTSKKVTVSVKKPTHETDTSQGTGSGHLTSDIRCFPVEPGVFDVCGIKVRAYNGDISHLDVECVINTANETLEHKVGVARTISNAAGKRFQQESREYIKQHGRMKVSECAYTSGCDLKYKCVIHAVGPQWRSEEEEPITRQELRYTIINSLRCVEQLGLSSVCIPIISADTFGVPKEMRIEEYGNGAIEYIHKYKPKILQEVHFVDIAPDAPAKIISDTFQRFTAITPSTAKASIP